jgi:DNA-binding response OmpR family regulator
MPEALSVERLAIMSVLTGCRVLLVEDDALIAMDVEGSLNDFGCQVVGPFGSVVDAIAALRTEQPDCAVLDLNLNGRLAMPIADALSEARVPFLFLSGHSRDVLPDRHRTRPFLSKPYLERALQATLLELCGPRG